MAFATRGYESAPDILGVWRLASRDELWLKWRVLGSVLLAIEINERKLNRRDRLISVSAALILMSAGLTGGLLVQAIAAGSAGG